MFESAEQSAIHIALTGRQAKVRHNETHSRSNHSTFSDTITYENTRSWLNHRLQTNCILVIVAEANLANSVLLAPWLSLEESERANRFLQLDDRFRSSVAHGLKRLLLTRLLDISPADLQFGAIAKGKPVCLNNNAPAFNLSHAQDWVALALADGCQLGVDIEFPHQMDYPVFAESVLTRVEKEEFRSRNYDPNFFLTRWSQKEAISKACGLGLYLDFTTVNTFNNNRTIIDGSHYYFFSQQFLNGFLSVATSNAPKKLQVIHFDAIKGGLMCNRPDIMGR